MIPVFIFFIHTLLIVYVFSKNYIEEGMLSAFLSILFVIIIFSVGWTFSEFVMGFFMGNDGLSLLFPRAAFSLGLLTILEAVFYRFYYGKQHIVKPNPSA
jgi:hypothetical protein